MCFKLKFAVISLFPEIFNNLYGLIQTARDANKLQVDAYDLREFGQGKYKKVDDQVYGGSDGMLLQPEVLLKALNHVQSFPDYAHAEVIALSPKGQVWTQKMAQSWSLESKPKILLCGRYAGFDQRFLNSFCDQEISIGDYVLNGGEVAALALIESVGRLQPDVLGNKLSVAEDSFGLNNSHRLEAPQFTRPALWNDLIVPEILLSGHHEHIELWKKAASVFETFLKRPDLVTQKDLFEFKAYTKNKVVIESLKTLYSETDFNKILQTIKDLDYV